MRVAEYVTEPPAPRETRTHRKHTTLRALPSPELSGTPSAAPPAKTRLWRGAMHLCMAPRDTSVLRKRQLVAPRSQDSVRDERPRPDGERQRERSRHGAREREIPRPDGEVGAALAPDRQARDAIRDRAATVAEAQLRPAAVRHQRRGGDRRAVDGPIGVGERDREIVAGEAELREQRREARLQGERVAPRA